MIFGAGACGSDDEDSGPTAPITISDPGSVDEAFVDPQGDYTLKSIRSGNPNTN